MGSGDFFAGRAAPFLAVGSELGANLRLAGGELPEFLPDPGGDFSAAPGLCLGLLALEFFLVLFIGPEGTSETTSLVDNGKYLATKKAEGIM